VILFDSVYVTHTLNFHTYRVSGKDAWGDSALFTAVTAVNPEKIWDPTKRNSINDSFMPSHFLNMAEQNHLYH